MTSDTSLRVPAHVPTRKVRRSGGSVVVTIPPEILSELDLEAEDLMDIWIGTVDGDRCLVLKESQEG